MEGEGEHRRSGEGDPLTGLAAAQTLPALLMARSAATPRRVAYRAHAGGGWHEVTWEELERKAREVAAALLGLGLQPGARVGVLGETRPEWGLCDLATLLAGGVSVGLTTASTPERCAEALADAACALVFVDNAAQLEKLRLVRERLPALRHLIVWDAPPDLNPALGELSLYRVIKDGHAAVAARQPEVDARWRALTPDSPANLIYTSGTSDAPRGALLSHGNLLATLRSAALGLRADDVALAFLPMSHAAEKIVGFYGRLLSGVTTAYARSSKFNDILNDIQVVQPTILGAAPRFFERLYTQARLEAEGSATRRLTFRWAERVGRAWSQAAREGRAISRVLAAQRALADRLVFSAVRARFGGRLRLCLTSAEPLRVELLDFLYAAGVLVLEVYGLTETAALISANRPDAFRFGSVGRPLEGVEVQLAPDGELQVRGPNVASSGWLATGDLAWIDPEGFLYLRGRRDAQITLAHGAQVAPQPVEALLQADPFVSRAVVVGEGQPHLGALIALDEDEAPALAERLRIPYRGPERMAADPRVRGYIHGVLDAANRKLSPHQQVQTFRILPRDLSVEERELTPTLKIRRQVVHARHAELVTWMFTQPPPGA